MKARAYYYLAMVTVMFLTVTSCSEDDEGRVQCSDPFAQNFDPGSSNNEGCIFPVRSQGVTLLADLSFDMEEISGLASYGDQLIGHNDQSNPAELFVFNTPSGVIAHTLNVVNGLNDDWEDLAQSDDRLFIANTGNNLGMRTNLGIHVIFWADFNPDQSSTVAVAHTINFRFPEQTSFAGGDHNFDVEALFYWDGYLYFFTKNRLDDRTNMYRIPDQPGPVYDAEILGGFNSGGRISGADISANGSMVALVGFTRNGNCFVWKLSDYPPGEFLAGRKERLTIGPTSQFGQMEGIRFDTDTSLYIASEEIEEFSLPPRLYKLDGF